MIRFKHFSTRSLCFFTILVMATSMVMPARGDAATEGATDATAEATTTALSDAAIQAKAQFDQIFQQYKVVLGQIENLRINYQTAGAAARQQINGQLRDHVAEAKLLADAMLATAVQTYELAPNAYPQITDLLLAVVNFRIVGRDVADSPGTITGGDLYDSAAPIITLLDENDVDYGEFYVWAFISAFTLADYDAAETYFQKAIEAGQLSETPSGETAKDRSLIRAIRYATALDNHRELWAQETATREAEAAANDLPRVKLTTTDGDITIELFENEAPNTVANFLTLVKSGFYDGLAFHRVIAGFVAQGGDPESMGNESLDYVIACECSEPDARKHFRGSLSMAHAGTDTGGSQFFLTLGPSPHLDGLHTVFGRVIDGLDVLPKLQRRQPSGNPMVDQNLPEPDRILRAEVLRDRGHDYTVEKLSRPMRMF